MSEEILKVLEKLKDKSNYQRDCNDGSCFIELFVNEIYILCRFIEHLQQKVEQLEKENKELNRMCELYGQSLYNADLTKAEKRVEQLENIIKEAREYINDVTVFDGSYMVSEDLLNILNKGSDKE